MNARSLCNKLAELHCVFYNDQIDILFVTESWLNSGIPNGLRTYVAKIVHVRYLISR